jgi:hypothetical protein
MQEQYKSEIERRRKVRQLHIRRRKVSVLLCAALLVMTIIASAGAGQGSSVEGAGEQAGIAVPTQQTETVLSITAEESVDESVDEVEVYGCNLHDVYDYPFNTMSQDWDGDDLEGFRYHEISEESADSGGYFPPVVQIYTFIVCKQYGVDYEMVFALIERESKCVYDAEGDNGNSVGYMQIQEKWHKGRMQRLGVTDLKNPFQNILVGVDILAELQDAVTQAGVEPEMIMADTLAAYQYGMQGARVNLWADGVHLYSYNQAILDRAEELRQEALEGR